VVKEKISVFKQKYNLRKISKEFDHFLLSYQYKYKQYNNINVNICSLTDKYMNKLKNLKEQVGNEPKKKQSLNIYESFLAKNSYFKDLLRNSDKIQNQNEDERRYENADGEDSGSDSETENTSSAVHVGKNEKFFRIPTELNNNICEFVQYRELFETNFIPNLSQYHRDTEQNHTDLNHFETKYMLE